VKTIREKIEEGSYKARHVARGRGEDVFEIGAPARFESDMDERTVQKSTRGRKE